MADSVSKSVCIRESVWVCVSAYVCFIMCVCVCVCVCVCLCLCLCLCECDCAWACVCVCARVCLLVGCLTPQQHASVSQGQICTGNITCCHTQIEVADQTFYLTQSQYTDTGPTDPSVDPIMPGVWQGSHWSASLKNWHSSRYLPGVWHYRVSAGTGQPGVSLF